MVETRLLARYGPADKPIRPPLDELVLTILSQNTTDASRDRAWERLRAEISDWPEVLEMPAERLRDLIRAAGLPDQKSRAIRAAVERLSEGGDPETTLEARLAGLNDDDATSFLTSFPGVGVKTAACVLCFSLRRPILPVDTHVLRLGRRLGWVRPGASATKAHARLNDIVPEALRFALHVHLIALGRDVCKARKPDCASCPLRDLCPRIGVDV